MSNNCLVILFFQKSLKSDLNCCLYCYMTFEFFRVSALKKNVISNTAYTDMAALHDSDCGTHPGCQSLLYFLVSPVSDDDFSLDSHTGNNMTVLSATMCRLVLIHEIHVDRVIWDFFIKLCVQMAQRFSVFFQTKDP